MDINAMLFEIDLVIEYKNVIYRVVSVLDNNLVLVVNKEDLEKEKFPLNTVVIPYEG